MLQSLFVIALVTTIAFILLASPLARRLGWVDHPGGHKTHKHPTPLVGGAAIFLGIAASLFLSGQTDDFTALLAAMALLLAIGLVDDVRGMRPSVRFLGQAIAVAILIVFDHTSIIHLGHIGSDGVLYLQQWSIPFTIFALVGLINAINLADGMDGLAGGLVAIALAFMAILAITLNLGQSLPIILAGLGALAAYLAFNLRHPWRQRASVFMGDSGSLPLGLLLGWAIVKLSQPETVRMPPVVALWLVAIPLLDTVSVMTRRIIRGRNPFIGDREHVHHLLQVAGFSHGQVVAILLASAALFGGIGILAWHLGVPRLVMLMAFLGLFLLHLWITFHAWRTAHYVGLLRRWFMRGTAGRLAEQDKSEPGSPLTIL